MRFLILSAVLACAAAAPSGVLAPIAVLGYPSALPTISPGDIQAAVIDAQVKAEDIARAAADKARELSEQAVENLNEKIVDSNDQVKEKAVEDFWSVEDKKWQALDAVKTAEAQLDGSLASNADALAKSAVVLPYAAVAPVAPVAPVPVYPGFVAPVAPVAPVVPVVKSAEKPEEEKKEEVKSAEPSENKDSIAIEAKPEKEKKLEEQKPLLASVYTAPLAIADPYRFPIVAPVAVSPVAVSPVFKYGVPINNIGLAPIIGKTFW